MLHKTIHYLLVSLLLLLTGCTMFVKDPVVTVKDVSVVSLDSGGAGMELSLSVKNPNPYELKLQGYSYDLKVMALPLAKGGAREEIKFPAEAERELRIPIRVAFRDLYELIKRKPDFDSIPYHLTAGFDLDTPLGQLTVPIDRTGTYAMPKRFRPSGILDKVSEFLRMNK